MPQGLACLAADWIVVHPGARGGAGVENAILAVGAHNSGVQARHRAIVKDRLGQRRVAPQRQRLAARGFGQVNRLARRAAAAGLHHL
jgi:hypothetical protein